MHSRVMPFVKSTGTTKTGRLKKPSWSLNKALGTQYNNMGKNKENLRRFRKQEDQAMIDSMNYALEKTCHLKPVFKLMRKTDKDQTLQTGLDHEVYKAKQHKLDELNGKLATTTKKLKDTEAKNETLVKQQDEREKDLEAREKRLEARERDLSARELGGTDSQGNRLEGLILRESRLEAREKRLKAREVDLNALQFGGYDSKGIKHKSIEQRIKDGIKAGMSKVLHPLKAFKHAYLSSLLHQRLTGVDEQQIKEIIKQQEESYNKTAMVAALSGTSGKGVQRQAVKAVGTGALAMAKEMPSYKQVSDAMQYAEEVQALEKEDERRKASKHIERNKDIMDTF